MVVLFLFATGCPEDDEPPSSDADAGIHADADRPVADGGRDASDADSDADVDDHTADADDEVSDVGLRYFGYALSGEEIDQVADQSNIVHISSDFVEGSDLPLFEEAERQGLSVALDLSSVFLPNSRCEDFSPEVTAEPSARWAEYADRIEVHSGSIALLYPIDEPYWNCCPPNGPLTAAELRQGMENVNEHISARFPSIPIGVIFAYPSVNDSLVIPAGFDWIGFDCYDGFDTCGSEALGQASIPEFLSILRSKMSPSQRLVLVPPAFLPGGLTEQRVVEIFDRYMEVARTDPTVVAIFGFLWRDLGLSPGARSLPQVAHRYQQAAAELIGTPAPGPVPPPSTAGPEVAFHDGSGTPRQIFNLEVDDVIGQIDGASPNSFWCMTIDHQGSCRDLASGEETPHEPWSHLAESDPPWVRDPDTGRWTLSLLNASLGELAAGGYVIHVYDAETNQRARPLVLQLARPPVVLLATSVDGPPQSVFRRAVDSIHVRIDFPPRSGLAVCIAPEGDPSCVTYPGEGWGVLPGPDGAWTFDTAASAWRTELSAGVLGSVPAGLYTINAIDTASMLRGTATAELVDE